MKLKHFLLTDAQIKHDVNKAIELKKQGLIHDYEIPGLFEMRGTSGFSWLVNLLLAIFLGFLGADRFYLKKYLSGVVKLITSTILVPLFIWLSYLLFALGISYVFGAADLIIFGAFFYLLFLGFYFGDIVFAIIRPRDYQYKRLNK